MIQEPDYLKRYEEVKEEMNTRIGVMSRYQLVDVLLGNNRNNFEMDFKDDQ